MNKNAGFQSDNYWSSSTLAVNPDLAWIVYFDIGLVGFDSKTLTLYVRGVRGGQWHVTLRIPSSQLQRNQ